MIDEDLLRTFIREALLVELRRDHGFIDHLRKTSGLGANASKSGIAVRKIADDWVSDVELELGKPVPRNVVAGAIKFVAARWYGVLTRFHGDERAALQTMSNLLDTRFSTLRAVD